MKGLVARIWTAAIKGKGRGWSAGALMLGLVLVPFSWLYGVVMRVNRARRNRMKPWTGTTPVVLVGNLTVGGTGKTPLVAFIAARLLAAGLKPAVLSRGYGGTAGPEPRAAGDGSGGAGDPGETGDEPALLARSLPPGIPVMVGTDRPRAASIAVERFGARSLVLDDSFQQRARFPAGLKIVTLNAAEPFGNGRLFPAGTLREEPEVLAEADAVVLTHSDEVSEAELERLKGRVSALAPQALLAVAAHRLGGLENPDGTVAYSALWIGGRRALALSAIGYPEGFERMLVRAGGTVAGSVRREDHHPWGSREVMRAGEEAAALRCDVIVTTAKDAVRLPKVRLAVPVLVARLDFAFITGGEELAALVAGRAGPPGTGGSPAGRG
jgi:tetraacyldisaccharide 4'-kinase